MRSATLHFLELSNWYRSGNLILRDSPPIYSSNQKRVSSPDLTTFLVISLTCKPNFWMSFFAPTILLHTPVMLWQEKWFDGLSNKQWIPVITLPHSESWLVLSLHHHFVNRAILREWRDPTPSPPFFLGAMTLSHATHLIFGFPSILRP